VFTPFFRPAAAFPAEGHGIGLALVAHIADVHGGHAAFIDVARGACLRVAVPAWSESPSPSPLVEGREGEGFR
jgi:signal transduction histidine kinase